GFPLAIEQSLLYVFVQLSVIFVLSTLQHFAFCLHSPLLLLLLFLFVVVLIVEILSILPLIPTFPFHIREFVGKFGFLAVGATVSILFVVHAIPSPTTLTLTLTLFPVIHFSSTDLLICPASRRVDLAA